MEGVVDQLRKLAGNADEAARKKLTVILRDLVYSFEDDDDVVHRIGYYPLQSAAVRTGIDMNLFELFSESNKTYQAAEMANALGGDALFYGRFLRYLASVGCIGEVGNDSFTANHTTRLLAKKGNQAGLCHMFDTCTPQWLEMPIYMKKVHYKDLTDHHQTVFQDAWKTKAGAFEWFETHPQELQYFNDYMAARRVEAESWLSVYPVEEETRGWSPDEPVYVNIGGSIGHQCADFKSRYPDVPGRVILQDLPHSIVHALQTPGVENMVHDFFQPQPVKNAKFYFLRGVLHDHPDDKVLKILQNTKEAMGPESVLLIDEMVLPDSGVHSYVAGIDLTMMCAAASRERTESQWQALIKSAGLRLVKSMTYKPSVYETIMALVPE